MAEFGSAIFGLQLNTVNLPAITGVECTYYGATQSVIEGPPGVYNFGVLDAIVDGAIAAGIRPALRIRVSDTIANDVAPTTPAALLSYGNFVSATATFFLGRVETYAIQNELNLTVYTTWTAANYAAARAVAYAAIKAVDPAAVVLDSGVTASGYVYYRAQELVTAGQPLEALEMLDRYDDSTRRTGITVPGSLDALTAFLASATIVRYVSFVNDVRAGIDRDGVQIHYLDDAWEFLPEFCGWFATWMPGDHYEVWETGWGWEGETDATLFDEDDHAAGMVRILAGFAGMGMDVVQQVPYYDNLAMPSNYWYRGLNTATGLRRAATAYETMASKIGNVAGAQQAWGVGVHAYLFGAVYVAWAERPTIVDMAFADEVLLTNIYGDTRVTSSAAVVLGPIPQYIESYDAPPAFAGETALTSDAG